MTSTAPRLEVRPRPRSALFAGVLVLLVVLGFLVWYANSPQPLPTSGRTISASVPVAQKLYVGVVAETNDFDRTLSLSGVKVHTTSNTEVVVTPLLCRGGTVEVTTDPEPFCDELVNPEGEAFGPDDDIVLEVSSDEPAIAVIDRVRLGFREGVQWGTLDIGAPAVVRVLSR